MAQPTTQAAVQYAHQAEKLSLESSSESADSPAKLSSGIAVAAKFITPLDPVIQTADGNRLPAVPVVEAHKFNVLKHAMESQTHSDSKKSLTRRQQRASDVSDHNEEIGLRTHATGDGDLQINLPPSSTHPLFPPLPLYGPASLARNLQCTAFRLTSFILSTAFLAVIVLGSAFTSLPLMFRHIWLRLTFRNPDSRRPFHELEVERRAKRGKAEREWTSRKRRRGSVSSQTTEESKSSSLKDDYEPTEGGPDPLLCDAAYYARRVGLDLEEFKVQTEDGFIITLWHLYDPAEYRPASAQQREANGPDVFTHDQLHNTVRRQYVDSSRRYPILLIHGLLQSAGAYCTNDDDSLAFFLCKSGYDVWLGNNRCGFNPEHSLLDYRDPRMWAWNIRQMGVLDLPALVSRVLYETGFNKLGLICHSQGTTEAFVALAKEQRPELGEKISVFCALAPAVYAGPLIQKMYFKFMRVISPGMFRVFFGIHAFIPLMMVMHKYLPGRLYGAMGYRVFSFLFNWTDERWDVGLRDRMFQFAPVYVSAESMRWWLGRECFASQRCILATREEGRVEDVEDEEAELRREEKEDAEDEKDSLMPTTNTKERRGRKSWFNHQAPPMALWICGSDDLVDGRRLLRRFERGREPHVKIVHAKVIEEYEHLDVLWAMDSIEKVGKEVREVIWRTVEVEDRAVCRTPMGCTGEGDGDGGGEKG